LKAIEITRQKTAAELTITQNQVAAANLSLQKLGAQIVNKQSAISLDQQALGASIRSIQTGESLPFIAGLFSAGSLSDIWKQADTQIQLNEALQSRVSALSVDTQQLNQTQNQVSGTKTQLVTLTSTLTTQKGALDATAASKQDLIAQTKSKESTYQSLIAQKKAQEASFENELNTLQNSLKSVSASQIPHAGTGILAWPFSTAFMNTCPGKASALGNPFCITQYFGNTAFATANASIYSGMGHDGLDIGVPTGTPVLAALTGTVVGTGNTDLAHNAAGTQCYSFGKWVMLQHSNGLNTMYAHLSVVNVSKGQSVGQGDTLGYSGMTGYATGPHLHFGVYATSGVQIITLNQFRGATTPCANATMPVAPKNAYLNPLSYLP
jgi:murein DD-endopeptidase MepM/ murein hydrolase activator NlpD